MRQFQASQIVYARVSKERSLDGKAGYQTLGYTRNGIPSADLSGIESRFVYYPREDSPPKRVCFATPSGRLVVAAINRLDECDDHGRMIGLAHGLVIPPDSLRQMPVSPLAVLDTFSFATDLQQALSLRTEPDGDVSPVTVPLPDPDPAIEAARQWPEAELRKLVFYALRAERLAERRMALAFCGSHQAILAALRAVQLVLPATCYGQCPMDSYFLDEHGNPCSLLGTYCWAVGMPSTPRSGNFIHVDAETRQVMDTPTWKPAGAYEHWLADKLSTGQFEDLAASKHAAWDVAKALSGKALSSPVPEAVITEIRASAGDDVRTGLRDRLASVSGAALARRLVDAVTAEMSAADIATCLRGRLDPQQLLAPAKQSYAAARFARPADQELADLARLLQHAPDSPLALLHAVWSGNASAQRLAAGAIAPEDYERLVAWLLKCGMAKPLPLVQPGRGQAFVAALLASGAADSVALPDLVERLLEVSEEDALDALTPLLSDQPLDVLKGLRRTCKSSQPVSRKFQNALKRSYDKALSHSGVGTRLRNMLGF